MTFVYDLKEKRGEEFLWRAMMDRNTFGSFAISDVYGKDARGSKNAPQHYLKRLIEAGFVECVGDRDPVKPSRVGAKLYRILIKRQSAPRIGSDGKELPERAIDTLWRTMKMVSRFTADELADMASTKDKPIQTSTARRYLDALARVGILSRHDQGSVTYILLKNVGGGAPRILRGHVVFDPNSLQVIGEIGQALEVHNE